MAPLSLQSPQRRKKSLLISLFFAFFRAASSFAPIAATGSVVRAPTHPAAVVATGRSSGAAGTAGPRFVASSTPTRSQVTEEGDKSRRKQSKKERVVFQKIVRCPPYMPDVLLLGKLVQFLETKFQLPSKLSMVYESIPLDGRNNPDERATLILDSPMSSDTTETRLYVEVIAIFTTPGQGSNGESSDISGSPASTTVPNMAMVAVKKDPKTSATSSVPPMMQNLFADSEKRIIKALDRAIDDFASGRIKMDLSDVLGEDPKKEKVENYKTAEEAIRAELMDDDEDDGDKTLPSNASASSKLSSPGPVQDAVVEESGTEVPKRKSINMEGVNNDYFSVDLNPKLTSQPNTTERKRPVVSKEARAAVMASMNQRMDVKTKTVSAKNDDFAIQAATRKAASGETDFAVLAARRRALENASKKLKILNSENKDGDVNKDLKSSKVKGAADIAERVSLKQPAQSSASNVMVGPDGKPFNLYSWVPPKNTFSRGFRTTISKPEDRKRQRPLNSVTTKSGIVSDTESTVVDSVSVDIKDMKPDHDQVKLSNTKDFHTDDMKVNLVPNAPKLDMVKVENGIVAAEELEEVDSETKSESRDGDELPSYEQDITSLSPQQQLEMEIAEAAQDALDEIAEQGTEMSAEDILRDVLKFDEVYKKENEPGRGFTSGAFDKAKELVREKQQQRQSTLADGGSFDETPPGLSVDQELKQMFEAGQSIADSRITESFSRDMMRAERNSVADEAEVDRLIAREKSISGHARKLDDELVELEVAVLSTPGEEFDGPPRNPFFDIMSGPEVYNPNVDPETVNYPGALPGTKKVKLPKELKEAVSQAQFAAKVLMQMETKEVIGEDGKTQSKSFSGGLELTPEQVKDLHKVASDAVAVGIIDDPVELMQEKSRLQLVLDELSNQPEERYQEIASNYKDLLLSENFVSLVKGRLAEMTERDIDALRNDDDSQKEENERERRILSHLVNYAQLLVKQVRALGAELEAQQLEIVRSICEVAMDPSLETEEETATALTDAVRDMRPLLDDIFVAYIKYAVAEEEARLARAGLLDHPDHNRWLFVLKIVQQGVYTEIARSINRYIDHIFYVVRMETPIERRLLLKELINVMPTLDVRPFVKVVDNIASSLGMSARGEFDGVTALGEMTNKLLQLYRDTHELLPPERIDEMSKDADEWARKQKQKLLEQRKVSMQRLKAARETEHLKDKIEAFGTRGDVERIPD